MHFVCVQDSKWTPLQLASRRGHFKIAKILLDNRADPNAQTIVRYLTGCYYSYSYANDVTLYESLLPL